MSCEPVTSPFAEQVVSPHLLPTLLDEAVRADSLHASALAAMCAYHVETRGKQCAPLHDARSASDREFCVSLLPGVSRTFAVSIEALPEPLREAVRVAYLLCRAVDTIEDEDRLEPTGRNALFDPFDLLLADDRAAPDAFEDAQARVGGDGPDGTLCRGAALCRSSRARSLARRDALCPHVQQMSAGMRATCARAHAAGGALRLDDLADLEPYCYFVARTVGNLLTALFEHTVPASARPCGSRCASAP